MFNIGDRVKIEDIGPLAEVVSFRPGEALLRIGGTEFWCPVEIISSMEADA